MEVQIWAIEKLIFYARNPRKNEAAMDRKVASLKEFGFKIPVLARSDGEVVDGHLRLKAARKLALKQVPVIPSDACSGAQVAFRDLSLTNFELHEIDTLLGIRRQGRHRIRTYALMGEVCDAAA